MWNLTQIKQIKAELALLKWREIALGLPSIVSKQLLQGPSSISNYSRSWGTQFKNHELRGNMSYRYILKEKSKCHLHGNTQWLELHLTNPRKQKRKSCINWILTKQMKRQNIPPNSSENFPGYRLQNGAYPLAFLYWPDCPNDFFLGLWQETNWSPSCQFLTHLVNE